MGNEIRNLLNRILDVNGTKIIIQGSNFELYLNDQLIYQAAHYTYSEALFEAIIHLEVRLRLEKALE